MPGEGGGVNEGIGRRGKDRGIDGEGEGKKKEGKGKEVKGN